MTGPLSAWLALYEGWRASTVGCAGTGARQQLAEDFKCKVTAVLVATGGELEFVFTNGLSGGKPWLTVQLRSPGGALVVERSVCFVRLLLVLHGCVGTAVRHGRNAVVVRADL